MVLNVKYSKNGLKSEVVTPGLAFDDFDRAGTVKLVHSIHFRFIYRHWLYINFCVNQIPMTEA